MCPIRLISRFRHRLKTASPGYVPVRVVAVVALLAITVGARGAYWLEIHDDVSYLQPKDDVDVMLIFNEACRLSNALRSLVGAQPFDYSLPPTVDPDSLWRAGGYFRNTTMGAFLRPPGYTLFLASVYALFYEVPQVLFLLQMLMGLATLFLTFLFARRVFGFWPAWVAALCLGVNWTTIYYETVIHAPGLTSFVLVLLLNLIWLLADNPRSRWFVAVGVALGFLCITATAMLLFAPFLGAWTAWVLYGHERRLHPQATARALLPRWAGRTLGQGMLMVAGMVLAMSPIALSNHFTAGRPLVLSTGLWFHLAAGNYPGQEGSHFSAGNLEEYGDWPKVTAEAIRALPGAPNLEDSMNMARDAVRPIIVRDPMRFLKFCVLRSFWFWAPWEYAGPYSETRDRMTSPVLTTLPWWFGWVVACAAAGLALLAHDLARQFRRGTRQTLLEPRLALQWLPVLVVAVWLFPYAISFMSTAHRVPILPLVFLFMGFAVVEIPRRLLRREWAAPGLALACGIAVAAFCLKAPEPAADTDFPINRITLDLKSGNLARAFRKVDNFSRRNPLADHAERTVLDLCAAQKDLPTAVAYYALAVDRRPEDATLASLLDQSITQLPTDAGKALLAPREGDGPGLWLGYGLARLKGCDEEGAAIAFERAATPREEAPGVAASVLYGVLQEKRAVPDRGGGGAAMSAACLSIFLENAVNSLVACGSLPMAAALLQHMALDSPKANELYFRQARLLRDAGEDRAAVSAYGAALEKGADDHAANELRELVETRIPQEERPALLRELLRQHPRRAPLRLALGRTLEALGKPEEALAEYREAYRLDGNNPACRLYLAQALAISGALDEALALAETPEPLPDYLRPELAMVYSNAGRYCFTKDDWPRAVSLFQKALSAAPDNLWNKCWLAEALVHLGRVDEARPLVSEVLAAEPANPMARTLLQRLEEGPAAGGGG